MIPIYHIDVQRCEGWYAARALEDSTIYTQGRTLDEVVENVRELLDLCKGEKDAAIELVVPASLKVSSATGRRARPRRQAVAK